MNQIRPTTIKEFFNPISNHVVPIYAFSGQESYVAGTAVIIAPDIAVTASHVLQGLLEYFGNTQLEKNVELDIYLTQFSTGATWYVCNTATWVGTDISVLSILPRDEISKKTKVNLLQITVDPPNINEAVIAYGYPKTKLDLQRNDSQKTKLSFSITPMLSEGIVTEIHSSMRDSVNLRFPCFAVHAEYKSGMSGGAVFNKDNELCGLVCSGGEGELVNYSHATSIWPMSIIPVILTNEDNASSSTYKILELAKQGRIKMNGHERIEFFTHENGSAGVRRLHKK